MAMQQAGLQGMQLGPSGRPMFMPQRFQLTQRGEMPQGGRGWLWLVVNLFLGVSFHGNIIKGFEEPAFLVEMGRDYGRPLPTCQLLNILFLCLFLAPSSLPQWVQQQYHFF